jgi:heme/copper-type cytochrome/quinol oxidase subunit 2
MDNLLAFGAASSQAGRVDMLFLMIAGIGGFFFFLTQGLLIYFAVKYRRRCTRSSTPTGGRRSTRSAYRRGSR